MQFAVRIITISVSIVLMVGLSFGETGAADLASASKQGSLSRWRSGVVRIALSSSFTKNIVNLKPGSDVAGALERSIGHWAEIADVNISVTQSDKQSISPSGAKGDGVSLITIAQTPENVTLFDSDATDVSARTRVFTDGRGGITEADIALNPFAQFSTDGSFGTYDLESVLTHEIGHLLGLRHSPVMGSVMHSNVDLNGVRIGSLISRKSLSAEDIATIRSLYGPAAATADCCGSVQGTIGGPGKIGDGFDVFVYNDLGSAAGSAKLDAVKKFTISGLTSGEYTAVLHDPKLVYADQVVGKFRISGSGSTVFNERVVPKRSSMALEYIGSEGLLTDSAAKVLPGTVIAVTIGGKGLKADLIDVGSDSPQLTVVPGSVKDVDYADGVTALRFELEVSADAAPGSYSLFVENKDGEREYLAGGLAVIDR